MSTKTTQRPEPSRRPRPASRRFAGACLLGVLACLWAVGSALEGPQVWAKSSSKPWNGGKPANAAVEIASSLSGKVAANAEQDFVITLSAGQDCARLSSVVRGIEGVEVFSPQSVVNHGPCTPGTPMRHTGKARIGANMRGYLVVEITVETEAGIRKASRSFLLHSMDPNTLGKAKNQGKTLRSSGGSGEPVRLLTPKPSSAPTGNGP